MILVVKENSFYIEPEKEFYPEQTEVSSYHYLNELCLIQFTGGKVGL